MICEPKHKFRPKTGDRAGNRQSCDGCHMARDPGYLSHLRRSSIICFTCFLAGIALRPTGRAISLKCKENGSARGSRRPYCRRRIRDFSCGVMYIEMHCTELGLQDM